MKRIELFLCRSALLLALLSPLLLHAEVHEYRLDNGLKLLVKEDRRAPVVVSQVWYRIGSSYEHNGITGVSHALEHMMFQGTEKYPGGEFSRIIAANGGSENAFTGRDYTAYFQTLEKSRLEISFELEADRMRNLLLAPQEFDKEIEVVKEERRLRTDDNPVAYLYESALAAAFQTAPYRHPIIGWMADLEAMTIDDLRAWYRRWYGPANAVVVVVGDVDHDAVRRLAQQHFGPIKAGPPVSVRTPPEVAQQGLKRVTVKRPAELPHLLMAYKTPVLRTAIAASADWEAYALEVLAGVLDGGYSARLETNLVRGQEVAASISASYNLSSRLDGLFTLQAVPARGKTMAELEQAVREQLQQLKQGEISAAELERVKAQVVSGDVYERDSLFYQALELGLFETVGLPWRLTEDYVPQIQSIRAEQVQQVANKYFHDDGLTVAVLEPIRQ
ncbi:MAG: pitrilysin family protein [Gammaproteobacteria bacterium]|nr:pitrilysin family protein [Gammaproteobacteria bacterium]